MPRLAYKTDRQRLEMESGNVDIKLIELLHLGMGWCALEYPEYENFTLTDIKRKQKEQDEIYLNANDPKIVEKYKKKPWKSVHQFWRGIDQRTNDMPKGMAERLTAFYNMVTYDPKRPKKKTAIYHDIGTGSHIHIQVMG